MAEKLGICTRYLQREITYAALQLADAAKRCGIPTQIVARDDNQTNVSSYDRKVIDERIVHVGKWMDACNTVIWTRVPSIMEVQHAKDLGVETCLLVNWEELHPEHEGIVRELNRLIVPYQCVQRGLQSHWYLKNVKMHYLPWTVHAPPCQANLMRKGTNVYFPLYDSQPQRSDQIVFVLMERILQEFPDTTVSIAYGHKWARTSRRILKRLKQKYNNRLIAYGPPDPYTRLQLFAKADLTVWLPRFESFALIGLASLAMGTPVISWDIAPQNEYLQAWKNSVLVPCKTESNWLGIPEVVGGYNEFEEQLLSTLRDRALLAKMKCATSNGLEARRKHFDAGWSEFLKRD